MTALPLALDAASVAVFALTGALRASRAQLDIIGFIFLAALTAVGGGTLRDLLLGRTPVFWIEAPGLVGVAAAVAVATFFAAHVLESRIKVIVWADAVALSVAVAAGLLAAAAADQPPLIQVTMGVITGCFGGLMRDVVVGEVPLVLRAGELYVSAAFAGAVTAVALLQVSPGPVGPLLAGAAVVLALRAGSLTLGWRLPVYRARPPR